MVGGLHYDLYSQRCAPGHQCRRPSSFRRILEAVRRSNGSGNQSVEAGQGRPPRLFHYREARGPGIDMLIDQGQSFAAVEIKSGATVAGNFSKSISAFSERMGLVDRPYGVQSYVVFGGEESQNRSPAQWLSWRHVDRIAENEK